MWDLPGPGLEPASPALAGGFSTTAPPGKPLEKAFLWHPNQSLADLDLEVSLAHNTLTWKNVMGKKPSSTQLRWFSSEVNK